MTPDQFIIWFKGFVKASNAYNITPKQWEDVKEQLDLVVTDKLPIQFPVNKTNATSITYGRLNDSITYTNS